MIFPAFSPSNENENIDVSSNKFNNLPVKKTLLGFPWVETACNITYLAGSNFSNSITFSVASFAKLRASPTFTQLTPSTLV